MGPRGQSSSLEVTSVTLSSGVEDLSYSGEEAAAVDIRHFLLLLLDEGLTIFYQPFTARAIEPQLFGALISAMSAFYADGSGPVGYRIPQDLEFRGYGFSASYGDRVTGILLHHRPVSDRLVVGLKRFVELFESQYRLVLTRWDGDARLFNVEDLRRDLFESLDCPDLVPHELTHRAMLSLQREPYGTTLGELRRYSARRGQFFIGDAVRRLASSGNCSVQRIYLLLSEMRSKGLINPAL
jgi:hypothetical protein